MKKILPFVPAAIVMPFLLWGMFGAHIAIAIVVFLIAVAIIFGDVFGKITTYFNGLPETE